MQDPPPHLPPPPAPALTLRSTGAGRHQHRCDGEHGGEGGLHREDDPGAAGGEGRCGTPGRPQPPCPHRRRRRRAGGESEPRTFLAFRCPSTPCAHALVRAAEGGGGGRGVWTAKTVKRPWQQPAHPQHANYWAPLTRRRHTMPHSAQPQHTNYWAPRTWKRHQREHRPQRLTESSDPTQHAKGRTGDRPGPRKGATTSRNVTQGADRGPLRWVS